MKTKQVMRQTTVWLCEVCHKEHDTVWSAEECQRVHLEASCIHHDIVYFSEIEEGSLNIEKKCTTCRYRFTGELYFDEADIRELLGESEWSEFIKNLYEKKVVSESLID